MKICRVCKLEKELSEFSHNLHCPDGVSRECKDCQKEYSREYYKKNKDSHTKSVRIVAEDKKFWYQELKKTLKCARCGFEDHRAIEFHHRDASQKSFGIALGICRGYSKDRILKEIDKCDPICANCHRIEHHTERMPPSREVRTAQNRNIGNNTCQCGNDKKLYQKYCAICSSKKTRLNSRIVKDRPPKEELIKLIEEYGYRGTGKLFGVSDNAIRKWLKAAL